LPPDPEASGTEVWWIGSRGALGAAIPDPAWGRNKKEAEQRAASNALAELQAARPAEE
jgi:dsRNA-specific ribonuclease